MSGRAQIAALIGLVAATVFAACGSHGNPDLPDVPQSHVLADDEIQSQVDNSWGRYLIVVGDDSSISASDLTKRIRAVLDEDDWQTKLPRHPANSVEAGSSDTFIQFGPVTSEMHHYVPRQMVERAKTTPGPADQKVFVAIR